MELAGCDVLPPLEEAAEAPQPKPKRNGDALGVFADLTLRSLTRNELAVWLVIYADGGDRFARSSQSSIAERAGISDRTVRRAIKSLQSRGLLQTVFQGGLSRGRSSYRVFPIAKGS